MIIPRTFIRGWTSRVAASSFAISSRNAPGEITPDLVAAALTPRTRLAALASCNFLHRLIASTWTPSASFCTSAACLFSLDAIQTLGAAPLSVAHVDFLSADAHKWMLGPMAIGIVFVKKEHF